MVWAIVGVVVESLSTFGYVFVVLMCLPNSWGFCCCCLVVDGVIMVSHYDTVPLCLQVKGRLFQVA